jgi:hypothetical protein
LSDVWDLFPGLAEESGSQIPAGGETCMLTANQRVRERDLREPLVSPREAFLQATQFYDLESSLEVGMVCVEGVCHNKSL